MCVHVHVDVHMHVYVHVQQEFNIIVNIRIFKSNCFGWDMLDADTAVRVPLLPLSLSFSDCEMNYFISGGACVMCPAGSMRDSDTSLHSCSCADNLVTQSGIDTTDGDNCDSKLLHICVYM